MVSMFDNQLKVNICSGPMDRRDYHMCECEKVYIQLKGDMTLRLVQIGDFKSYRVPEGNICVVPSRLLHSPYREPDTSGLVMNI